MRAGTPVGAPLVNYQIRLSIRDATETRPALEIFEEAFKTWRRLLADWWLIEPEFVGGQ
jgi:hypothetical protein